ncbi:unnamed protein product [Symbiodinium sp. CCMP2592]|nr:unnamed protein product [Symbiodinium sp. CCMP2592]
MASRRAESTSFGWLSVAPSLLVPSLSLVGFALLLRFPPHSEAQERLELISLWEEHLAYEFDPAKKSTAETMRTMTRSSPPSVAHLPTLVGGSGLDLLSYFYENHFIFQNPPMQLLPLKRTVSVADGSLVDEMVVCLNHTSEVDWMLPGVPPTHLPIRIPLVASVSFGKEEGRWKLTSERIYWDQASVLRQVGLLEHKDLPISGKEQAELALGGQGYNEMLKAGGVGERFHPPIIGQS